MAHRETLNEKQLNVLRWIADGCPDGVLGRNHHRISAAALRSRGLATTSGRGPSWSAKITEAGRKYIAEADGPDPPVPRQANTSVTAQLVADVIAAGGSLRVPRKHYDDRDGVDYEQRARLAERYGKVPDGKRLEVQAVSPEELQIDLVDLSEGASSKPEPVPVPDRVSRYHPVVRQFKERPERHEVSRAALPRVLRILQALTVEAERRGYEVALAQATEDPSSRRDAWSGGQHGHIVIVVRGHAIPLRVSEEGLQSRTYWENKNSTWSRAHGEYRSLPLSEYEANATGRVGIETVSGYGTLRGSPKWADRRSGTLEEKLPLLLHDLESAAAEREGWQREVERRAIERKRQWQAAVDRARERHAEHHRGEVLRAEAARWREAEQIRAYCDAVEVAYPEDPQTAAWVAWGRRYADELDSLRTAPHMPSNPESVSSDELRPFLEGWSPYGPDGRP